LADARHCIHLVHAAASRNPGGSAALVRRDSSIKEQATKTYEGWIGRDAYNRNGDKIGKIENIYYDDYTARPSRTRRGNAWRHKYGAKPHR
jgi:hypothetical protein